MYSVIKVDMFGNFGNYSILLVYSGLGNYSIYFFERKPARQLLAISILSISTFTAKTKFFFFKKRESPMSLMRFIRLALHSPKVTTRTEEDRRLADRRIVSRLSSGNIRLQRGEYVTREDIEEQYERVKSFNFDGE